jgi:hypothetical protein
MITHCTILSQHQNYPNVQFEWMVGSHPSFAPCYVTRESLVQQDGPQFLKEVNDPPEYSSDEDEQDEEREANRQNIIPVSQLQQHCASGLLGQKGSERRVRTCLSTGRRKSFKS